MNKIKAGNIFKIFTESNPEPTTELIFNSNFELLISVILSAQATDKSVNHATHSLFQIANTPEQIIELGITKLKDNIKTIGLFNNKAKNIILTCNTLIKKFNSQVPHQRESLEELPGVGRKTANVILNTVFGKPVIAVDTHVFRVSNRIGLAKGDKPLDIEKGLTKIIPEEYLFNAHHHLILHGRYTCRARQPLCYECKINKLCESKEKYNDKK
ncbi:MAG: endonuclease III [Gammaproteobacteria bacterium]|jgi:endonuclease-3|nr:endonuclease III [Gammaproteobacteria bacterium]MBT6074927.1 endonuclease III [Gammaproteobacteria bacterium]MBT7754559.1 endonuclease III [Gammaproteobacteria bacterium]MDG2434114.1 endonuclease III [Gammaproteobacteria bacterium]